MASVSVTALILHPESDATYTFLVGKTKSGIYKLPGGNLDYGASWNHFAHKQVLAKTALNIEPNQFKFCFVSNDKVPVQNGKSCNRHYVDIIMSTLYKGDKNKVENLEKNEYESLDWVDFRYHGIDEDKVFGALSAVLTSSTFHPIRSDAYSSFVSHDNLINNTHKNGSSTKPVQDDQKTRPESNKNGEAAKKKPALECPFVIIEDEVYQIKEDGLNASMNVTSYNGELLPPFLSAKGINWLNKNYRANKFDIFIDTYAKSGTTLSIKLVHQILSANKEKIAVSDESAMSDPWRAVPWIEAEVSQQLFRGKTESPQKFMEMITASNEKEQYRIWKSHMSYNGLLKHIDQNGECKVIHTLRNPKSVFCSYLNFFKKEPLVAYKGDTETLFNWFCDGTVVHSNYWDYELEWIEAAKHNKNILLITFEDIVRFPHKSIKIVADFLNIDLNQEQIDIVAEEISFDKMKKQNKSSGASILMNKGGIARWKTILSPKQSARIDRITKAKFKHIDVKLIYE